MLADVNLTAGKIVSDQRQLHYSQRQVGVRKL
jgi:hypothetical protein